VRSLRQSLIGPIARWAQQALEKGDDAAPKLEGSFEWQRLRLRDGQAGKQFAILRDERTLRSTLLGLSDGRQVAVQILSHSEELGAEDLIVQIRPWKFQEGRLFAGTEWIVRKGQTLAVLRDELAARFALIRASGTDWSSALCRR